MRNFFTHGIIEKIIVKPGQSPTELNDDRELYRIVEEAIDRSQVDSVVNQTKHFNTTPKQRETKKYATNSLPRHPHSQLASENDLILPHDHKQFNASAKTLFNQVPTRVKR